MTKYIYVTVHAIIATLENSMRGKFQRIKSKYQRWLFNLLMQFSAHSAHRFSFSAHYKTAHYKTSAQRLMISTRNFVASADLISALAAVIYLKALNSTQRIVASSLLKELLLQRLIFNYSFLFMVYIGCWLEIMHLPWIIYRCRLSDMAQQ